MPDWNNYGRNQTDERDIEELLSEYYGPGLREQPLSYISWERLKGQLGAQNRLKGHAKLRKLKRPSLSVTPPYIQDAFVRIANEAHTSHTSSLLECIFRAKPCEPSVNIKPLMRRSIRLTLPFEVEKSLERAELDVLLATGLARYLNVCRSIYVFIHLLLFIFGFGILIASLGKIVGELSLTEFLIAICLSSVGGLTILLLLRIQGRKLAFRVDRIIVNWLGRNQVCQGLHALADRSRKPNRGKWNEPSLTERIERVCGTHIETRDHNLTLVR